MAWIDGRERIALNLIGWFQIIGGVAGIILIAYVLLRTGEIDGPTLLLIFTALALFSFSNYAGIRLLDKTTFKLGVVVSMVNQGLQVVHFDILGYGFAYSSGAKFSLGYDGMFSFDFSVIQSSYDMSINSYDGDLVFMINIVPVVLLSALIKLRSRISNKTSISDKNES